MYLYQFHNHFLGKQTFRNVSIVLDLYFCTAMVICITFKISGFKIFFFLLGSLSNLNTKTLKQNLLHIIIILHSIEHFKTKRLALVVLLIVSELKIALVVLMFHCKFVICLRMVSICSYMFNSVVLEKLRFELSALISRDSKRRSKLTNPSIHTEY